jgi:HK97 family phage major capsid protein
MTIDQLIEQVRQSRADKLTLRKTHTDAIEEVRSLCLAETRDPTEDEAKAVTEARAAADVIDADVGVLTARIAELTEEKSKDEAADRLAGEFHSTGAGRPHYDQQHRVGDEPRTYTLEKSRKGEARWINDAYKAQVKNDPQARERIERHGKEVEVHGEMTERALSTGGIAGLVPPQFLIDMAAPILRNGRPFANAVTHKELPETGMQLNVPRMTTGGSESEQATENAAVSSTDEVWSNLSIPVCTVAGQAPVSRQVLERGEGMEEMIFLDLVRAYASRVDFLAINGTGSSGQPLGVLNTAGINAATAFGAVPGAANFTLKVAGQITAVTSQGAGVYPKLLVAHPRRWGWLTGIVDASNRPVVLANPMGPYNALATITAPGEIGADADPVSGLTIVGTHSSGLPILTDLNIPVTVGTNSEDVVLAVDTDQVFLWEDGDGMPNQLSFEQTAGQNLTTTVVVYGYVGFTAGRYPGAVGKLGGLDTVATQGLVAPTF